MKTTKTESSVAAPFLRWTPALYRALLRVTRRHGMFTIARRHVRQYPCGQIVSTPVGGRMFIPPDPHFIGFLTGLHEEHITEILRAVIKPGSICLDVGANIGYFTVMMSMLARPTGRIYAFEPEPKNFSILTQNSLMACEDAAPVIARNEAISDTCGFVSLVTGEESTLHSVSKSTTGQPVNSPTRSTSIDSLSNEIGNQRISLIKIDVEGHELPAILGARDLICSRLAENLVLEVTPGEDAKQLEALLSPHARRIRSWITGKWSETRISDISIRTDIWVQF